MVGKMMEFNNFRRPLGLSPSKPVPGFAEAAALTHGARPRDLRVAFDKLRLSGVGVIGLALLTAAPALAGKPKPGFEAAVPPAPVAEGRPATGAIFDSALGYASLIQGTVARRVGDPVTILLIENTITNKTAGAKTGRNGNFSVTPPSAGPLSFLDPNALNASGQSSFKGDGSATQTSQFNGAVGVTIAEVRPNGTALVRGEKRLLLSQGQEWIQFSGIVRLIDIDQQNQVRSNQVADVRVEYAGNGSIQRASREGWLSRFFNLITPF
ncbi:flagellar basal body L-ring protein FlgH [Novosphingobium aerophilum]|jgi:flagellar L-ring protein precursor FlgH|uniref:flagellar basal body L-ring protein FlgH n=1 Tax=Novosphingobium aerophilum TaxID=2839843 RepID=UPI001FCFBBCD|nr:flagellar basal body L-ring protein FlgH [Novosphingobium aerophilum]